MKSSDKIVDRNKFRELVERWKQEEGKIVFTNGCFDILHPGHLDYLERSKGLGTKLVIGLNTDGSVSRLKGSNRPINDEEFRSRMLAALECVDLITLFDEDTPLELIREVKPDILVKGSDYRIEEIVGAEEVKRYGGEVKTISLLPGFSTTSLIENIKRKA